MIGRLRRWFQPFPETAGGLRLGFVAAYIGVVGALVVYTNAMSGCAGPPPRFRLWGMVTLLTMLLLLERFELARDGEPVSRRVAVGLLLARAVLVQGVVSLDCTSLGTILYPLVPFSAYFTLGNRLTPFVGLGYWLWVLARSWRSGDLVAAPRVDSLTIVVIFTLLLMFMQVIARHIDRDQRSRQEMQRLLVELEASHRQLRDYADRVAELATAAERNRLARDIHDTLGHYLTAINIQLEKAQTFRVRSPEEADQAIHEARQSARAALQDVRQSVSVLRTAGDRFSLRKSLTDLVGRMDGDSFEVRLQLDGDESDYAGPVLTTLYRVAQEGLTNVRKHARAKQVVLEVHLGESEALLRLRDDGAGFDTGQLARTPASPDRGYGIQGLQERLELVRGQMQISSDPVRGTELTVIVPKQPAELAVS